MHHKKEIYYTFASVLRKLMIDFCELLKIQVVIHTEVQKTQGL